jgi:hypothetical protein
MKNKAKQMFNGHTADIVYKPITAATCKSCNWKIELPADATNEQVEDFQRACFNHIGVVAVKVKS